MRWFTGWGNSPPQLQGRPDHGGSTTDHLAGSAVRAKDPERGQPGMCVSRAYGRPAASAQGSPLTEVVASAHLGADPAPQPRTVFSLSHAHILWVPITLSLPLTWVPCAGSGSASVGIWLHGDLAVGHCRYSCQCDSPTWRCCAYSAGWPCLPVGAGEQGGPSRTPGAPPRRQVVVPRGTERCRSARLPRSQMPNLPCPGPGKDQVNGSDRVSGTHPRLCVGHEYFQVQ